MSPNELMKSLSHLWENGNKPPKGKKIGLGMRGISRHQKRENGETTFTQALMDTFKIPR